MEHILLISIILNYKEHIPRNSVILNYKHHNLRTSVILNCKEHILWNTVILIYKEYTSIYQNRCYIHPYRYNSPLLLNIPYEVQRLDLFTKSVRVYWLVAVIDSGGSDASMRLETLVAPTFHNKWWDVR